MSGEMEKLFSTAGRVYVLLRRETNRMIDVEWVSMDAGYAREVIHLARATGLPELLELADRIEEIHPLLQEATHPAAPVPPRTDSKYMTSLR